MLDLCFYDLLKIDLKNSKRRKKKPSVTGDISVGCQVEGGEVVVVPQLDGEASVYL